MSDEQKFIAQNGDNRQGMLKKQITGWTVGLLGLGVFLSGGIYLLALLIIVMIFVAREYYKILKHKGFHPSLSVMIVANICFALLVFFRRFDLLPFIITLSIVVSFLVVLFKGRQPYIANVATSTLGFMYGGWLPCHTLLLRQYGAQDISLFNVQMNEGLYLTVTVFIMVLVTDIGAYFFGKRHGKHKLAEVISPKKTVEGALAGGFCAILFSLSALLYTSLNIYQCLTLGFIVTVFAQLGDLSESLIKRDAGVKDSSDMLPGHGGFLDRIDGYIFAIPASYYYITYFTHGSNMFLECFDFIKGILSAWM